MMVYKNQENHKFTISNNDLGNKVPIYCNNHGYYLYQKTKINTIS